MMLMLLMNSHLRYLNAKSEQEIVVLLRKAMSNVIEIIYSKVIIKLQYICRVTFKVGYINGQCRKNTQLEIKFIS
jgi:hypothetical protein